MSKPQLKYRTSKFNKSKNQTVIVTIALDDDCNNGHADFSITASIYDGTRCTERNMFMCGCCHDEILEVFPEYKCFVDLHLSDNTGVPMYASVNGYYHLRDKDKTAEQRKATTQNHMRVNNAQFEKLNMAEDQEHFHFIVEGLGLPAKWQAQAQSAIVKLEALVNKKWDFKYKWERMPYKPMVAEAKDKMEKRLNTGYYTTAAIDKRRKAKALKAYKDKLAKLKADAAKEIAKITLERDLFLWLHAKAHQLEQKFARRNIEFRLVVDNCIYYSHTNELVFNWQSYGSQTAQASFDRFEQSLTEKDFQLCLPHGIVIALGKGE